MSNVVVFPVRESPNTECPFCMADSCRIRWCSEEESSYAYTCLNCGHYFDTEFHFKDPTDWKDD